MPQRLALHPKILHKPRRLPTQFPLRPILRHDRSSLRVLRSPPHSILNLRLLRLLPLLGPILLLLAHLHIPVLHLLLQHDLLISNRNKPIQPNLHDLLHNLCAAVHHLHLLQHAGQRLLFLRLGEAGGTDQEGYCGAFEDTVWVVLA